MHRAQYLLAYCEADVILGQPRKNPSASHLIGGPRGHHQHAPSQQDPFLLFLHTFLPKVPTLEVGTPLWLGTPQWDILDLPLHFTSIYFFYILPPGGMISRGYICNLNHKINPKTSMKL